MKTHATSFVSILMTTLLCLFPGIAGAEMAPCCHFGQKVKQTHPRKLPALRIDGASLPPCGVCLRASPCGGLIRRDDAATIGISMSFTVEAALNFPARKKCLRLFDNCDIILWLSPQA